MKSNLLVTLRALFVGTVCVLGLVALAVFGAFQGQRSSAQTPLGGSQGQAIPAVTAQQGQKTAASTDNSDPVVIMHQRDSGTWSYTAERGDHRGLTAGVVYKHDSVDDIKAYAAASKALLPEIARSGGRADVVVTFVFPVEPDWFRAWAKKSGLQVAQAQLQTQAPGPTGRGGMGIFGRPNDPLPQDLIDESFFRNSIYGVFDAYGSVDASRLAEMSAEPKVFLVDVLPTWVRRDVAQAGITETMKEPPIVDSPFGYMERMGLKNFTDLPLPTIVPPPVGTITPPAIPTAP